MPTLGSTDESNDDEEFMEVNVCQQHFKNGIDVNNPVTLCNVQKLYFAVTKSEMSPAVVAVRNDEKVRQCKTTYCLQTKQAEVYLNYAL